MEYYLLVQGFVNVDFIPFAERSVTVLNVYLCLSMFSRKRSTPLACCIPRIVVEVELTGCIAVA